MRGKQKTKKYLLGLAFGLLIILMADYLSFVPPATGQAQGAEITLTWSTDSYTPSSYPGKALPVRGSIVEVAANIESRGINPQEVVYDWFLNDYFQKSASGEGKQVFKFDTEGSIKRRHLVKVEIKNKDGELLGSSSYLPIELHEPQIVLRPIESNTKILSLEDPQLISQKYQISANQEIEFVAQPYFFNIENINELNYSWGLGRKEASAISLEKPNVFILKVGQLTQAISQNLRVWAENKNNALQRAQTQVEIILTP